MCEYCKNAFGKNELGEYAIIAEQHATTNTGVVLLHADLSISSFSTLDVDVYAGDSYEDPILTIYKEINYCPICGAKLPKEIES